MEEQILDYEGALERLGGDEEFLLELLEEMLIQLDSGLLELKEAVAEADYEKVKRTAHGLKGASANLNIDRLAQLFKQMEVMANEQNLTNADTLMQEIIAATEKLRQFVKSLV